MKIDCAVLNCEFNLCGYCNIKKPIDEVMHIDRFGNMCCAIKKIKKLRKKDNQNN